MIEELIKKHPLISDQIEKNELRIILQHLEKIIKVDTLGAVVEMGCYAGTTSLFISRILKQYESKKQFLVYDSFSGLPEKTDKDRSPAGEQFVAGELAVSKKQFIENYKKAALHLPIIHKNWFGDLTSDAIPEKVAFAFLDGDYYESIQSCIRLIENKLTPGAVVIVDDYQNEALPGARKAVDEWINKIRAKITIVQSLAVIEISKQ